MDIRDFLVHTLKESGALVNASFGEIVPSQKKMEKTQIVTEVDVASERLIIEAITKSYPQSGIIAEESGFIASKDSTYFIIDPIDGTSNFANAIPWFGVMIAFLKEEEVIASGIYLPQSNELYVAQKGKGVYKNGSPLAKPREVVLSESLVSFSFSSEDREIAQKEAAVAALLAPLVLNLRTTNSAYDYAYAAEGKFAATINVKNKIWDIAPIILIAGEAGMFVSDIHGNPYM